MIAVLEFLGTNCQYDVVNAYKRMGYETKLIWHTEGEIPSNTKLAVIPGGFSYGDYLRCGAIAARSNSMKALKKYAQNGGLVLGICNGFQILCESRLLPGILMRNNTLKFISKNAILEVADNNNKMLGDYAIGSSIDIPIAHAEGNYQVNPKDLENMYANGQVILKYRDDINGSTDRIAGICNKDKNIFALMPHPERVDCGNAMLKSLLL